MKLISIEAGPLEKLDVILTSISNEVNSVFRIKNNVGGTVVDLANAYMYKAPEYFGLRSKEEMKFYLDRLLELRLLSLFDSQSNEVMGTNNNPVLFPKSALVTFKGLEHLHAIEQKATNSNKCFVAMAFDENKNERLEAINIACQAYGFTAITVDLHTEKDNYTIDAKILSAIKSSKFCIADFTKSNNGVYMEAGYAMGRDKKVIFICEKQDFENNRKHFDVRHYPFHMYNSYEHLISILKPQIGAYIEVEKRLQ